MIHGREFDKGVTWMSQQDVPAKLVSALADWTTPGR